MILYSCCSVSLSMEWIRYRIISCWWDNTLAAYVYAHDILTTERPTCPVPAFPSVLRLFREKIHSAVSLTATIQSHHPKNNNNKLFTWHISLFVRQQQQQMNPPSSYFHCYRWCNEQSDEGEIDITILYYSSFFLIDNTEY